MPQNRLYRPPRLPEGGSWAIGAVVAFLVFLITFQTRYLPFWAAACVAFLLLLAIGFGIDWWDQKALYYKQSYDQLDKAEKLLADTNKSAKGIKDKEARQVLASIIQKTQKLLDPETGKITPEATGDQFLSTATSLVIAMTTVSESAARFESLESSFSLDDQGRETLKGALEQFHTIDEWLTNADKQLHAVDRVDLSALNEQMKSYKYRSL